jgi:hypothetical protein
VVDNTILPSYYHTSRSHVEIYFFVLKFWDIHGYISEPIIWEQQLWILRTALITGRGVFGAISNTLTTLTQIPNCRFRVSVPLPPRLPSSNRKKLSNSLVWPPTTPYVNLASYFCGYCIWCPQKVTLIF